jgi:hypothetical protein
LSFAIPYSKQYAPLISTHRTRIKSTLSSQGSNPMDTKIPISLDLLCVRHCRLSLFLNFQNTSSIDLISGWVGGDSQFFFVPFWAPLPFLQIALFLWFPLLSTFTPFPWVVSFSPRISTNRWFHIHLFCHCLSLSTPHFPPGLWKLPLKWPPDWYLSPF